MISTVIIIFIVVLFVVIGVSRGAARTLLSFAAMIACSALAHFLSAPAAQALYDNFIRARVLEQLESTIAAKGAEYAAQNSLQALPQPLSGTIGFFTRLFGVNLEDLQGRLMLSGDQTESIDRSIEKQLGELAVFFLTVICSAVLFFVLWFVFRMLIRLVLPVFNLPLVRQVNKVLGGVLGALEGAVFVCFLANVFYLLVSCTNPVMLDNGSLFGGLFDALLIMK